MNKVFQRIFSALVVVAITISLFPALKVNAASSGTLSSGVKWELDDYGTLTFSPNDSGEGVISDCSFLRDEYVVEIVIEDGITEIEECAFYTFLDLSVVSIPGSVKNIGERAFAHCGNLYDITINEGVETIGIEAFYDCYSIDYIIFPLSIIDIGSNALGDCYNLQAVAIYGGLYSPDMFYGIDPEIILFYNLSISGGHAPFADYCIPGDSFTIYADVPEGKEFVHWEVNSGSVSLTDATSAKTSFIMPDEDIEITAVYKDITNTVTFDSNGHGTAPAAQTVTYGEKVTKPSDLTETGYTFGGWYTDSDCTSAYEFDTPVKSDFKLYAKWTAVSTDSQSGTVKPVANTYTVVTGVDGTWDGVSDYVVRVKSDDDDEHCIDRFLWAAVDGHELEVGKEAENTRGSTIVTIKSDYLKTLSAGTHNIVVNFTDNSITTTLTISNAPATSTGSSIPSTGEMQSPAMYVGLAMIVAAGALSVLIIRKRKEA